MQTVSADRRLFELARQLSEAKRDEDAAKARRIKVEEEIAKATGFAKASGQESYEVSGEFGRAKLTLKQPVTTAVVEDDIPKLREKLGRALFGRLFRTKYSIVAKALATLEKDDRDKYLVVAESLDKKPGKVAVELKLIEAA